MTTDIEHSEENDEKTKKREIYRYISQEGECGGWPLAGDAFKSPQSFTRSRASGNPGPLEDAAGFSLFEKWFFFSLIFFFYGMNRDEGFSYILFYVYKGFCVCIFVDFFMKETEKGMRWWW